MRKLNDMYHINGEQLIKTSNNQPVPEDEPVFILRARDSASIPTILFYKDLCADYGTPGDRISQLSAVVDKFAEFEKHNETKMKVPGVTHGA